ncbi:MAG: ABC transporter permease [Desulfovibrio sp.]|uniref:ABC transporter permease n=1 Tax=Desulfovibrio sp. 7SRBS1 TaxID=3378064 RepID=UPI003B4161BA
MRKFPGYVGFIAWVSMAFLYIPLIAVASFSINKSRFGLDWKGLTLDWYFKLFHNHAILEAAGNTLILAVVSTVIATVLGTALAIGLNRFPWPRKASSMFDVVLNMPVVVPEIVFAAALVIAFALLRYVSSVFSPGLLNMIIGHVTFQVAFVALVVRARLEVISTDMEEAARDLYADNAYLLKRVTLPLLKPGIVSGAMIAFTLSLDDFVISFFTAGPTSVTLPLYIYASVRRGVTPEIHALSTLVLLVSVIMVVLTDRMSRKSKK